jgi:ABC-type polysaccharide/polyol phosphate export permease
MATAVEVPTSVIKGDKPLLGAPIMMFRNARSRQRLIRQMISRDLRLKYHKSIFGWLWSLIEPLTLTITFWLMFEILSVSSEQYRPLNILVGIMIWTAFGRTISQGTRSLENNSGIIQRVAVPREIFIHSIVGVSLVTLFLNLLVVIPLMAWYGLKPGVHILYLPLAVIMLTSLSMGISFFTSILQSRWRDFTHLINLIVRIGFYLSPVFYTLEMMKGGRIPEQYIETYLWLNPMAVILTLAKCSFTGQELGFDYIQIAGSFTQIMLILFLGTIWFIRKERKAVKYL